MALTNTYLINLLENVKKRNQGEPEFIQAVTEVIETLEPVINKRPDLVEAGVFERIVEPGRGPTRTMILPLPIHESTLSA